MTAIYFRDGTTNFRKTDRVTVSISSSENGRGFRHKFFRLFRGAFFCRQLPETGSVDAVLLVNLENVEVRLGRKRLDTEFFAIRTSRMPHEPDGSITQFFGKLRHGDRDAAAKLMDKYLPRLVGLARKTLTGNPRQVADEQDAAQSAFVSFWKRAERGDFGGDLDRDEIWKLLSTITVRKALKQVERERAQKRGGGQVYAESVLAGVTGEKAGAGFGLDQQLGALPAEDFDLVCEELLMLLDEEPRAFALMRLLGHKNREIAEMHGCTERKVERKLNLVRLIWQREIADD